MAFSDQRGFGYRVLTGQESARRASSDIVHRGSWLTERRRSSSRAGPGSLLGTARAVVVLSLACLALTASAASAVRLPADWSHVQVNVVIKHVAHTLIYDRGSIARVTRRSLTLREPNGIVVVVRVAPSAAVTLGGRPVTLAALRPGELAMTVRIDGAPARTIRVDRVAPAD